MVNRNNFSLIQMMNKRIITVTMNNKRKLVEMGQF